MYCSTAPRNNRLIIEGIALTGYPFNCFSASSGGERFHRES
jgi:hypothetical protein